MKTHPQSKIRTLPLLLLSLLLILFTPRCSVLTKEYPSAETTVYASTATPPVVEFVKANATSNTLTFTIRISGFELIKNVDNIDAMICEPLLTTDENLHFTILYRESLLPSIPGEPLLITYQYGMKAGSLEMLNIRLDITLGPCSTHFDEMSTTPAPPIPLIEHYSLNFEVPIQ